MLDKSDLCRRSISAKCRSVWSCIWRVSSWRRNCRSWWTTTNIISRSRAFWCCQSRKWLIVSRFKQTTTTNKGRSTITRWCGWWTSKKAICRRSLWRRRNRRTAPGRTLIKSLSFWRFCCRTTRSSRFAADWTVWRRTNTRSTKRSKNMQKVLAFWGRH